MNSSFRTIISPLATLGHFWQEPLNRRLFYWNSFFLSLQIIYLLFRFSHLPPQIPLYFSQPWGESQLAAASALFILPTLSVVVLLINSFFAAFLLTQSRLLSRVLIIFSLVYSLLSFASLFQIINLVS